MKMTAKMLECFEIRTPKIIERDDIGSKVKDTWKLTKVDVQIVKETEKAILIDTEFNFDAPDKKMWIPKSLVNKILDYGCEGVTLELPVWFVIENNL